MTLSPVHHISHLHYMPYSAASTTASEVVACFKLGAITAILI